MNQMHQHFLAECRSAFSFLIDNHGFSGPVIEVDERIGFIFVVYCKDQIGVECIWDQREQDVSVKIVRLTNGRRPIVYRCDQSGKVWREHLTQILLRHGVRDLGFRGICESGLSSQQAFFRKALLGFARLLRMHGGGLLDGSSRVLDDL